MKIKQKVPKKIRTKIARERLEAANKPKNEHLAPTAAMLASQVWSPVGIGRPASGAKPWNEEGWHSKPPLDWYGPNPPVYHKSCGEPYRKTFMFHDTPANERAMQDLMDDRIGTLKYAWQRISNCSFPYDVAGEDSKNPELMKEFITWLQGEYKNLLPKKLSFWHKLKELFN